MGKSFPKPIVYNGAPDEFGQTGLARPKKRPVAAPGENFRPQRPPGSSGPGSVKFGQSAVAPMTPDDRFAL